jgi:DNA primase
VPLQSEATLAAIKQAVDIVSLIGDYLPLRREGSRYKALCPFHDDHKPSLVVNPERQTFKCWPCGASGDIFDFVKEYERVDFPEALQMLATRAGIALEERAQDRALVPAGPSKTDLLAAAAWAQSAFAAALPQHPIALEYLTARGLTQESITRFRLGYAPESADWLQDLAAKRPMSISLLEHCGLIARDEQTHATRARFRGRVMFPIHDLQGKCVGFGGRILPVVEQRLAAGGFDAAKYVNTPETPLFQKRKLLYAADLARPAARQAGWVAVVEGYTDVIAAHQVGLMNVVGTLGTALGDDHVRALRSLADCAVLVFDGDNAGQSAAERALELFLGHEVDARVLALPAGLDPCDFLLTEGADAFRSLVDQAVDPLDFAIKRAEARFDLASAEGARRAAEWVLTILVRVPHPNRMGLSLKVAKALDLLSRRLGLPVDDLRRRLRQIQQNAPRAAASSAAHAVNTFARPVAIAELDPTDRELLQIVLSEHESLGQLVARGITAEMLRSDPLRPLLQTCLDLYREGEAASLDRVTLRLDDPHQKALAIELTQPIEAAPLPEKAQPAPWQERLEGVLAALAERARQDRLRNLKELLAGVDSEADPETHGALSLEYLRLLGQRPGSKTLTAS